MTHTTNVIFGKCTGLLFCEEEELLLIVKEHYNHT
jgi:hypothetical protein